MNFSKERGFTLIELLVVIAIIGILASVVLASLGGARERARLASAQASLKSVQAAAIVCMDAGQDLGTPGAGTSICAASAATYPALPPTWGYSATGCTPDLSVADLTFNICASGTGGSISCNQNSCTTT